MIFLKTKLNVLHRLDKGVLIEKVLPGSIFEKKDHYKTGMVVNLWKDSMLRLLPKFLLS